MKFELVIHLNGIRFYNGPFGNNPNVRCFGSINESKKFEAESWDEAKGISRNLLLCNYDYKVLGGNLFMDCPHSLHNATEEERRIVRFKL